MAEIREHPFVVSRPPRIPAPPPPTFDDLSGPVGASPDDVDEEIMKNMKTLWRNVPDTDIVEGLLNDESAYFHSSFHIFIY